VRASEANTATKLVFEFMVLTATRSGEARGAEWSEVDLDNAVWTIPAGRMKAKKPHRVPLSRGCLSILKKAENVRQEDCGLIFPGAIKRKPLSDMTLSKLMKELKIAAVPHGFRSSFRDWAGEQTTHPREVIEFALAHVIKDKAEAAYARSDLFDKRSKLMDDWSLFVASQPDKPPI
jgi:integrase